MTTVATLTERHPHARAVLSAALPPEGSPSHAYLFHGPAGAASATWPARSPPRCWPRARPTPTPCALRVAHGVHPDLTWVAPSGAAEMLVADVEEPVVAAATRTPFEARRRVFVLERAETMSDQVANKMLKTLEEPPPFAHLVLLTSRPGRPAAHRRLALPARALRRAAGRGDRRAAGGRRGRCGHRGRVRAPRPGRRRARPRAGRRRRPRAARRGADLARAALHDDLLGRPWLAILAVARGRGDAAQAEIEAAVAADLELLPKKDRKRAEREAADAARRAARRARTGALDLALQVAGLWLRDVAVVRDGAEELVHATDRRADLRADAEGRDAHRLRAGVALVDDARAALAVNPTEELAARGAGLPRASRASG